MPGVQTVDQATAKAREYLSRAGHPFSIVTKVVDKGSYWLVWASSLLGGLKVQIDRESGEVIGFEMTK